MEDLKKLIRDVPDFPKPGIVFKDITTLIKNGEALKSSIDYLGERYKRKKIDAVVGVEARGFIVAGALSYYLSCGMIPVRKKGKLPYKTRGITYSLEYGTDTLEIHEDAIEKGSNILIADDVLATGGTVSSVAKLVKDLGGNVVECAFLIELTFLNGRDKLKGFEVFSLIKY